eukprot:gene47827-37532_t
MCLYTPTPPHMVWVWGYVGDGGGVDASIADDELCDGDGAPQRDAVILRRGAVRLRGADAAADVVAAIDPSGVFSHRIYGEERGGDWCDRKGRARVYTKDL